MDERLRRLEREARTDPLAAERLAREHVRLGRKRISYTGHTIEGHGPRALCTDQSNRLRLVIENKSLGALVLWPSIASGLGPFRLKRLEQGAALDVANCSSARTGWWARALPDSAGYVCVRVYEETEEKGPE